MWVFYMDCKVIFKDEKFQGTIFEVCYLDFGNGCLVKLRDYNAVDKIRLIKSFLGV